MRCEDCGLEEDSVKRFKLFGQHEPGGTQQLCFDCRWPYIRTRVFGPDADGPPGSVVTPNDTDMSSVEDNPAAEQADLSEYY